MTKDELIEKRENKKPTDYLDMPGVLINQAIQDLQSLQEPILEIEEFTKEEKNILENRPQSLKDCEVKIDKLLQEPTDRVVEIKEDKIYTAIDDGPDGKCTIYYKRDADGVFIVDYQYESPKEECECGSVCKKCYRGA